MPTDLDSLVISCRDLSTDHSATDPELPVSATSQEVRLAGISSVRQSELARWLADTALHANFTRRMQNTCTSQHPLQLPCCQPSNLRDSPNCLSFQGLDLVITIWPRLSKDFERDREQANRLTTDHWDILPLTCPVALPLLSRSCRKPPCHRLRAPSSTAVPAFVAAGF